MSSCSIIRITNALGGSFTIWDFGFQDFWILGLASLLSTVPRGFFSLIATTLDLVPEHIGALVEDGAVPISTTYVVN
jgi:hypothetical protein